MAAVDRVVAELKSIVDAMRGPGRIWVPPSDFAKADGTPLGAPSGADPGLAIADSESQVVRWLAHATPAVAVFKVFWSEDLDTNYDATVKMLVSKSGATLADATTMTLTAFNQVSAALHDADTNFGGVSNALTGNLAAKTLSILSRTLAKGDLPTGPACTHFTIKPTDGLLGTDNLNLHMLWVEYTKKKFA